MQIVISGTHASGKSTLISDFTLRHPAFETLPDPYELLDEIWDRPGPAMFLAQLRIAAARLMPDASRSPAGSRIAERGPLDFLAYLEALSSTGRAPVDDELLDLARDVTAAAMQHVDLLVVLPLTAGDPLAPPPEEDRVLRAAMNDALLDLIDDAEYLSARTAVVEIVGDPDQRRASLEAAVEDWRASR